MLTSRSSGSCSPSLTDTATAFRTALCNHLKGNSTTVWHVYSIVIYPCCCVWYQRQRKYSHDLFTLFFVLSLITDLTNFHTVIILRAESGNSYRGLYCESYPGRIWYTYISMREREKEQKLLIPMSYWHLFSLLIYLIFLYFLATKCYITDHPLRYFVKEGPFFFVHSSIQVST